MVRVESPREIDDAKHQQEQQEHDEAELYQNASLLAPPATVFSVTHVQMPQIPFPGHHWATGISAVRLTVIEEGIPG